MIFAFIIPNMSKPILSQILCTVLVIIGCFSVFSCDKNDSGENVQGKSLEISSWWTAEGENNALGVLQTQFMEENPNFSIVNSYIAGGSGTIARKQISERLRGGNPPDVFQVLIGDGFIKNSVMFGQLEPLTFLYKEQQWQNIFAPEILDELTYQGDLYALPLNIHRSNLIWYKPELFASLNIPPMHNMDDLISACEILAENGIAPISLGDKLGWTSLNIFENILLSQLGADKYLALWDGTKSFLEEDVTISLNYFMRIIEYTNSDHRALSWDEAIWNVVQGNGGLTIVGDWGDSFLYSKGFERQVDYTWIPFPGTEDLYCWLSDGFVLPKGSIERNAALRWLRLCGSLKGQESFNYFKSSLPPRLDADLSQFSDYQKSAYADFQNSRLVGSVTHGVLISDNAWFLLLDIINDFVVHKNEEKAQSELENLRLEYIVN